MPEPGSEEFRPQSHADVEAGVSTDFSELPKDTRPPLWTVPVLIVAVRMPQSRNELTPPMSVQCALSDVHHPYLKNITDITASRTELCCWHVSYEGGGYIHCLCHADSGSVVSCICLQAPLRCAACYSGCLALAADRPPAPAWRHHPVLATLRRFEALLHCLDALDLWRPVIRTSQRPSMHLNAWRAAAELKQRTHKSGLLMLLSGAALAMHFSLWVEGIETTSITHALFFSSVTPIIIAGGMWALGLPISNGAQTAPEQSTRLLSQHHCL